jgi:hypothetical protein
MTMKMRMPMLIATGMVAILMAANAPHKNPNHDPHSSSTDRPRSGQSCEPLDHSKPSYTCPAES